MLAYLVRRVLYAIPILIGVNLLTFVLFSWAVVYFRAPTIPVAWDRTLAMFGFAAKDGATLAWNGDAKVIVVALVIALAVQAWLKPRKGWD